MLKVKVGFFNSYKQTVFLQVMKAGFPSYSVVIMNLLYLTFGTNPNIHAQAAFSICSFLKQEGEIDTINIITDTPFYYNHLQEKVNIIPITKEELRQWEGEYQFFWRVKIKAIERLCIMYPGRPVMYLDSDTFLLHDFAVLTTGLQTGKAYMHQNEGPLSAKKSKTERKMWQQIKQQSYGGVTMQSSDCMWNAGVVATPNLQQAQECALALAICDEMCKQQVTRRLIEQYALSLALQHTYGLHEAKQSIVHYWALKDVWNAKISDFFLQAFFSQKSLNQVVQQFDPNEFTNIPLSYRNRNINQKIKKWVDKLFPAKNPVYIKK